MTGDMLYLFLLGLAAGLALLATTAYRRVSPTWLKWLLIALGLFTASRYVVMALFTHPEALHRFWGLRRCWLATTVGLTLPSVFAVDQLLRHPAISPAKLLRWLSPLLLAETAVIALGRLTPAPDRVIGWLPRLSAGWQVFLSLTQGLFVISFIAVAFLVMRKIPSRQIRFSLLGLVIGQGYLGFDGVVLASGHWYFRPFLYSEMVALVTLWYAFETSAALRERF